MRSKVLILLILATLTARAEDRGLVGHWKLAADAKDSSGLGNHGKAIGVEFNAPGYEGAAKFDGKSSAIEIPPHPSLNLGKGDFTVSAWVHTEAALDDVPGDLLSKFDRDARRGFHLGIKSGPGMTNSQANDRNLHFDLDSGTEPSWANLGRPGKAVYVMAMAVHEGELFVGTCEDGSQAAGHVYRYGREARWIDCGSPDKCNAVTSLASHNGKLYAGTGRYRLAGSSLPESKNDNLGGKIASYAGDGKWTDCGRLPNVEAVGGMVVFRGELYASSLYKPAGFFRYRGETAWATCPLPADGRRVVSLGVFNGYLYASSYDSCSVARFDGKTWEHLAVLETSGQTYSFEVHKGELFVGTWPNGQVFRFDQGKSWVQAGRLGEEKEVMGMAVHNGKLYAGTLPLAEIYRLDGATNWTKTGRIDLTPDVRYRRAWSMAVFDGRLFCGTLPSGEVHALTVGQSVTHDRALSAGRRHVTAVREGKSVSLFIDGKLAAKRTTTGEPLDVSNSRPLLIGFGENDHFRGGLSDVRLYDRVLSSEEITNLARKATR